MIFYKCDIHILIFISQTSLLIFYCWSSPIYSIWWSKIKKNTCEVKINVIVLSLRNSELKRYILIAIQLFWENFRIENVDSEQKLQLGMESPIQNTPVPLSLASDKWSTRSNSIVHTASKPHHLDRPALPHPKTDKNILQSLHSSAPKSSPF